MLEHPAIAEVAVVPERDPAGLEKPIAHVVLKAGCDADAPMEEVQRQFTKERLAPYQCPRAFYFVSELPKTASGKLQGFKLRRKDFAEGLLRAEMP